jgi:aminoglycoside phosphotransferase (APT) family kinase protein
LRWAGEWRDWYVVATDALPRLHSARRITVDDAADIAVALARGIGEIGPVVHGDFASWNLLATGSGLALLDWEWSKEGFDPMVDLAHFVIQEGALLHRYAPEHAKRLLIDRASPGWRYCEQVGVSPRSAPGLVRNVLERRRDPSEFTRELRGLLE